MGTAAGAWGGGIIGGGLSAWGASNLTKNENVNKQTTVNMTVNAQNKTDAEIIAIFQKAMSGEIDTASDLLNPTQNYKGWAIRTTKEGE